MEAALLELLAAAAWAGIVPPDTLKRVNKRLRRVGKGQTGIPRTGGPPLLILLGRIRESVPARELANRILKRPDRSYSKPAMRSGSARVRPRSRRKSS